MQQDMHLPQLLLVFFVLCLYQAIAISGLYNPYPGNIILTGKQSSSNSSSLLAKDGMESGVYHYAVYMSNTSPTSVLTGGMATFDVYGLQNLKNDQISSSVIWVINQQGDDYSSTNAAIAGWTVNPSKYGDSKTHFFTLWTADGYNSTGCYNLACDGFVPVNNAPITPGDTLEPTDGQLKVTIKIFKNKDDGDWWLHFGYDNQNLSYVGYWPKSIFNNLADHANHVHWGGFTGSYVGNASPAMGNGQWPGKNSATIRDVKYVDSSGQGYEPAPWPAGLVAFASHKKCYGLSPFLNDMFYYGGPGGCTT